MGAEQDLFATDLKEGWMYKVGRRNSHLLQRRWYVWADGELSYAKKKSQEFKRVELAKPLQIEKIRVEKTFGIRLKAASGDRDPELLVWTERERDAWYEAIVPSGVGEIELDYLKTPKTDPYKSLSEPVKSIVDSKTSGNGAAPMSFTDPVKKPMVVELDKALPVSPSGAPATPASVGTAPVTPQGGMGRLTTPLETIVSPKGVVAVI